MLYSCFFSACILILFLELFSITDTKWGLKPKFDSTKIVPELPKLGFRPPESSDAERFAGETCQKEAGGFYTCNVGLQCRRLERPIIHDFGTLAEKVYYCLPPGKIPSCQQSHGGELVLSYNENVSQYFFFCYCSYPKIFTNDQNGDCTVVTACSKPIKESEAGGIETLDCTCDKFEEFLSFKEGGPRCAPVNFFTSREDPETYQNFPKISWDYVAPSKRDQIKDNVNAFDSYPDDAENIREVSDDYSYTTTVTHFTTKNQMIQPVKAFNSEFSPIQSDGSDSFLNFILSDLQSLLVDGNKVGVHFHIKQCPEQKRIVKSTDDYYA